VVVQMKGGCVSRGERGGECQPGACCLGLENLGPWGGHQRLEVAANQLTKAGRRTLPFRKIGDVREERAPTNNKNNGRTYRRRQAIQDKKGMQAQKGSKVGIQKTQ